MLSETAVVFKAANKQVKDSSFTTTRIDIHYAITYILMIDRKIMDLKTCGAVVINIVHSLCYTSTICNFKSLTIIRA